MHYGVVVVGAGVAGLTVGSLLAKKGKSVLIFEHLGKRLVHGDVNKEMPVWDEMTERWGSIRDRYKIGNRSEMRRFITALVDTPFEGFDTWDDRSRGVGVDRAAQAGLTVAEDYLGCRLPGFQETWRY